MVEHGFAIRLLVFVLELFFQIAQLFLQSLVILLQLQFVRFELDVLGDHLLNTLLGALIQRLVEEMNPYFQVEILLGQSVDRAALFLQCQAASAFAKGRRGSTFIGRQAMLREIIAKLSSKGARDLYVLDTFCNGGVRGKEVAHHLSRTWLGGRWAIGISSIDVASTGTSRLSNWRRRAGIRWKE